MAGDEEGGLEKHVIELSNGLAHRGYQVSVIAHAKYQNRLNIAINFFAVDLSKSRRNPIILWQLFQAIKKSQPDVLHVQANKAVVMVAPLLNWLDVPCVATLHNKKNKLQDFMRFDRVIAVSQQVAAQFKQQDKVRVVLNGVSMQAASKALIDKTPTNKTSNDKTSIKAIAIGRLVSAKGFDLLISAWQKIDAKLQIIGDGPDYNALQSQIYALGLEHHIELLGHRQDVPQLLSQADVFIISSRNEGGPYTLAEALLMQTPVLSTDVGMVAEVLPRALICEVNNSDALHNLLKKYLQDLTDLSALNEPVYEFAKLHLTFDAMLDKTIAVYQELVPELIPQTQEHHPV